ncbi:UNVERIFIED_CONTAM: hypothetical protein K2H54_044091 [Gekko kuhli]
MLRERHRIRKPEFPLQHLVLLSECSVQRGEQIITRLHFAGCLGFPVSRSTHQQSPPPPTHTQGSLRDVCRQEGLQLRWVSVTALPPLSGWSPPSHTASKNTLGQCLSNCLEAGALF